MRQPGLLLALLAVAPPLFAQPSLAGPRLFPRGARTPGIAETRLEASTAAYLFTLRDLQGQALVEYRVPLRHPNSAKGMLRVEETTTGVVPVAQGGLFYRTSAPPANGIGSLLTPAQLASDPNETALLVAHTLDLASGTVRLRYRDTYATGAGPIASEKTYVLRLVGKALEIVAASDASVRILASYNHAGFTFDRGEGLPLPSRVLRIPYMDCVPVFCGGTNPVFCTRFIDWYASHGSDNPSAAPAVQGSTFAGETSSATYRNDQNELAAAIAETAYVIVSRDVADLFPVVDRPPSEYRLLLASRAVSQNAPGNSYAAAKAWVDRCLLLGLDEMQHIKWDWSRWPFNLNDPDYLPAAPAVPCGTIWGTAGEWLAYANACAAGNWGLAPYFEGGMMDPGYPSLTLLLPGSLPGSVQLVPNPVYDAAKCTRDAALGLKKGWDTNANLAGTNLAGQGHPVDLLAPNLRPAVFGPIFARIRGPQGFPTGGLHIDAKTDIPAWIEIDQQKGSGKDRTIRETLLSRETYFQLGKDALTGPLMGENSHWRMRAFESYAAGLLDGTSRKIPIHWDPASGPPDATCWDAEVVPDYELTEILPRATGMFGMGWESHFRSSSYPVPDSFVDAWHTTLLSYGHAPYFGTNGDVLNNYWSWRSTVRSYFLLHGVSHAMRSSRVAEIRYVDAGGGERDLNAAIALGLDLAHPRLVLRFANGLEFKANHSATGWATTVLGVPWTLPSDGFAGAMPGGLLAVSALNPGSGARVDYAFTPGHSEVIDRRGIAQSYAGFPGALLPVPSGLFTPPVDDKELVIVRDLRKNQVVYASGFQTARVAGTTPRAVALRVAADDTTMLSLGRLRLGLRAIATLQNGTEQDVTGLVQWGSGNPGVATVTRFGAVQARGIGQAQITALLPAISLSAALPVDVSPLPVLTSVKPAALSASQALLTTTTDTNCPLSALLWRPLGATTWNLVWGSSDPAQKAHGFHVQGLAPATTYEAFGAAANGFGLVGISATGTFMTP